MEISKMLELAGITTSVIAESKQGIEGNPNGIGTINQIIYPLVEMTKKEINEMKDLYVDQLPDSDGMYHFQFRTPRDIVNNVSYRVGYDPSTYRYEAVCAVTGDWKPLSSVLPTAPKYHLSMKQLVEDIKTIANTLKQ